MTKIDSINFQNKIFENVRGLLFDLDGTLVDSALGLTKTVNKMLEHMGLPTTSKTHVINWIGNGTDMLVERALSWSGAILTVQSYHQARILFDKYYYQHIDSSGRLFPQVKETLAQIIENGLLVGLVTNKPRQLTLLLLESLKIRDYFSLIIGGDEVVEKKPHPAALYLALGRLGLRANEVLFVGDSRNDIMAAQAAGCPSVGLTYGYNYGESIELSNPDCILQHFADLLPVIGIAKIKRAGK